MKKKPLIYIDLYSGIGGVTLAIKRTFPKAICAGYSEIEQTVIKVYEEHFPGHKNLGDVSKIKVKKLKKILAKLSKDYDLMICGGSPCQNLSNANMFNQTGLEGDKSILFWEFARLVKKLKPKYFLLENVASMKTKDRDIITETLGVEPIRLGSGLVSVGHRERLYWCNWKVTPPKDMNLLWPSVRQTKKVDKEYYLKGKQLEFVEGVFNSPDTHWNKEQGFRKSSLHAYSRSIRDVWEVDSDGDYVRDGDGKKIKAGSIDERRFRKDGKANTLVTSRGCGGSHSKNFVLTSKGWRLLTRLECARIQTFPDDWCKSISTSKAYKAYGNAVTVRMIEHIMSQHPKAKRN